MMAGASAPARGHKRRVRHSAKSSSASFWILLLLLSFVMPFYFYLGSFRISAYRAYLLISIVPTLLLWLRGSAGQKYAVDYFIIFSSILMTLSIFVNHGVKDQWEFSGILTVETLAPYFLARVMVQDIRAFQNFVWWLFVIILVLLPFAVIESFTNKKILLNIFDVFFDVYRSANQEPRLGLYRAQVSTPHPILFGVYCSSAFALVWYTAGVRQSLFKRMRRSTLVGAAVFFSLSAGAFMAVFIQGFLIFWDEVFKKYRGKWVALSLGVLVILLGLELASNRNLFQIVASEFTFSKASGYNRILIFTHTKDDILDNPFFGIGLGQWTRPLWLRGSVDNFWLLLALRYGLPAWFFFFLVYLLVVIKTIRVPLNGYLADVRTGYVISLLGIGLAAFTVHLWEAAYCMFLFLLGCGVWLWGDDNIRECQNDDEDGEKLTKERSASGKIRYTRFD